MVALVHVSRGLGWNRMALWLGAIATGCLLVFAPVSARSEPTLVVRHEGSSGGEQILALSDLDQLPQVTIQTTTPWTTGVRKFSGPPLLSVLEK